MTTRRVWKPILGWSAFTLFFVVSGIGLFGGQSGVASLSLNSVSHAWLLVWTAVVFVLLVVLYSHDSDAVDGTFELIEARKRDRPKWLLKGAVLVTTCSAVAWIAGYACLARVSIRLSGAEIRQAAVVSAPNDDRVRMKCDGIRVRLEDGSEEWICTQWVWSAWVPASARCVKVGDAAEVAIASNPIGTTIRLVSVEAPTDC